MRRWRTRRLWMGRTGRFGAPAGSTTYRMVTLAATGSGPGDTASGQATWPSAPPRSRRCGVCSGVNVTCSSRRAPRWRMPAVPSAATDGGGQPAGRCEYVVVLQFSNRTRWGPTGRRRARTIGRDAMEIGYTEEHQALRNRLREYYANLLTPEVEAQLADSHGIGPNMRRVVKQMAEDGWLGIGWPTEYGGQGLGAIEQYIFFDESMRAGAPVPMLTINTVGPTIMNFGTEEQKAFFLPKILAGEIHFCIGYTEPNSGTDLASLTTRAVRDGDE